MGHNIEINIVRQSGGINPMSSDPLFPGYERHLTPSKISDPFAKPGQPHTPFPK